MTQLNKVKLIVISLTILISISMLSGCISSEDERENITLKVLHAGSLTSPFEKIEAEFEKDHPNIDLQLEPAGSVACVNKITETGIEADILASADYSLIPSMMFPDYADWYIIFANNEMVLTYSESSKYADEIDQSNWFEILRRPDVLWAFSNPNLDPCGYRTPMVIQLSEMEYGDDQIFEDLIENHSNITCELVDGSFLITTPEDLGPDTDHLTIRNKSVELISMVESGGLDYAWEYLSVAIQNDMKYIQMPDTINLSSVDFEDSYCTVSVKTSDDKLKTGKPIVYGITIPNNAPYPEEAIDFIIYVINEFGQGIFEGEGQPPIVPPGANSPNDLPEELKEYVVEI